MKIEIDLDSVNSATVVGELFRELTFTTDGYGCYSNFDLYMGVGE